MVAVAVSLSLLVQLFMVYTHTRGSYFTKKGASFGLLVLIKQIVITIITLSLLAQAGLKHTVVLLLQLFKC